MYSTNITNKQVKMYKITIRDTIKKITSSQYICCFSILYCVKESIIIQFAQIRSFINVNICLQSYDLIIFNFLHNIIITCHKWTVSVKKASFLRPGILSKTTYFLTFSINLFVPTEHVACYVFNIFYKSQLHC